MDDESNSRLSRLSLTLTKERDESNSRPAVEITKSLSVSNEPYYIGDKVFIDPKILSANEIIEEESRHKIEIANIKRQLDDDLEEGIVKGETWRARARKALRYRKIRLDQLSEESRLRLAAEKSIKELALEEERNSRQKEKLELQKTPS